MGHFANNIGNIADLLGDGLSNMSIYFLVYILLNTFVWLPLDLYRPLDHIKVRLGMSETNRYVYSEHIPRTLLIFTIVLTYSVMNPIMWIFGLIYFVFATIVYTYNLSMSYVPAFDTGPKQWI